MPDADKKKNRPDVPGIKAWLSDTNILEVSLVKSPFIPCSPEAGIQITKVFKTDYHPEFIPILKGREESHENQVRFQKRFMIQKIDAAERKIYGYVYPANKADLEGDAMTPEELEKAAHSLLMNLTGKTVKGEGAGLNHQVFENIFKFTESAIDQDGSLGRAHGFAEPLSKAWFIGGFVPNDEIWKAIKSGEISGFSWGGLATRTPAAGAEKKAGLIQSALNKIRLAISKGEPPDFAEWQSVLEAGPRIDDMIWTLGDVIYWIMVSDLPLNEKIAKVKESILQFYQAVTEVFSNLPAFNISPELAQLVGKISQVKQSLDATSNDINSILKTFEGFSKGDEAMTPEDVKKALEESLAARLDPVTKKLEEQGRSIEALTAKVGELDRKVNPPQEKKAEPAEDPVLKALTEIQAGMKELGARLEKVETTPLAKRSEEAEGDPEGEVQKDERGVIKGKDGKHDYSKMMAGTTIDHRNVRI